MLFVVAHKGPLGIQPEIFFVKILVLLRSRNLKRQNARERRSRTRMKEPPRLAALEEIRAKHYLLGATPAFVSRHLNSRCACRILIAWHSLRWEPAANPELKPDQINQPTDQNLNRMETRAALSVSAFN